jgi:uncharacterized protein
MFWCALLMAQFGIFLAPSVVAAAYSAVATHQPSGVTYRIEQQSNRVAASTEAVKACHAAHPREVGVCALTELAGKPIITAVDIKSRVSAHPHPLYLWRFDANGSTVHLAGSIHILPPGFYPLPRQFEDAFDQSDYLVLEVDTTQTPPATLQALSIKHAQLPMTMNLRHVLPKSTYSQLANTLGEYGVDLQHFARLKPNFVTQQLALLALLSVGYDPESGLESHFRKKIAQRPILQLETVAFQLELLFDMTLETQVQMTQAMLEQIPDFEIATADLITAWLAGDDTSFAAAIDAQSGDTPELIAFGESLIQARNQGMADTVTKYLQRPGNYFVLIGSAHLIGEEGVPNLLAKAGYKGIRYQSNSSVTN